MQSNRRSFEWVSVAPGAEYMWVADEQDWFRSALAKVTGRDRNREVLLAGNGWLTAGYRQPAQSEDKTFNAALDHWSAGFSVGSAILGLDPRDNVQGSLLIVAQCSDRLRTFPSFEGPRHCRCDHVDVLPATRRLLPVGPGPAGRFQRTERERAAWIATLAPIVPADPALTAAAARTVAVSAEPMLGRFTDEPEIVAYCASLGIDLRTVPGPDEFRSLARFDAGFELEFAYPWEYRNPTLKARYTPDLRAEFEDARRRMLWSITLHNAWAPPGLGRAHPRGSSFRTCGPSPYPNSRVWPVTGVAEGGDSWCGP